MCGNSMLPVNTRKLTLLEIENLYQKYIYDKPMQYTIVTIAYILNFISMFKTQQTTRMFISLENTNKEKMQLSHEKQKEQINVLRSKLNEFFEQVILKFDISEFESAFQMVLSCIFIGFSILDAKRLKKNNTKHLLSLCLLISKNLNDIIFDHIKDLLKSIEFRNNCLSLISLVENSQESDQDIPEHMAKLFMLSEDCFHKLMNDINNINSNENLEELIDTAAFKCSNNLALKISTQVNSTSTTTRNEKVIQLMSIDQDSVNSTSNSVQWQIAQKPLSNSKNVDNFIHFRI